MISEHSSFKEKEQYVLRNIDNLLVLENRLSLLLNSAKLDIDKSVNYQTEINKIISEKTQGFPWLAEAISDYFLLKSKRIAESLTVKSHPAYRSAEKIKEEAKKRRIAEKQYRIAKYILQYYESLFPWLVDFRGEDIDDLIRSYIEKPQIEDEDIDPVRKWVTKSEYEKLSVTEKNQLALDRYWTKKKSKWDIGRDYERYIGYLYEKKGYSVYYQGIVKGLEDLGRDLVVTKEDNSVVVIQCKNWSKEKVIHEKHICQFKGTVLQYVIEEPSKNVVAEFYTSTTLSDTAKKFAKALQIKVVEDFSLQRYPSIKCNIARRTNEKIYHLPFDQQYDRTLIEAERNECYVETVAEAEKLGFRRAWKWHGEDKNE